MAWFKRQDNEIENSTQEKRVRTEGLWVKCEGCEQYIFKADLENNQQVCPKCGRHHKIDARSRVATLLEPGYELVDLELLGRTREQVIHVLIVEGLRAVYDRFGISQDPAAMARNLLEAVSANWDEVMSDEEIGAIETTRKTLERIAQVRNRDT